MSEDANPKPPAPTATEEPPVEFHKPKPVHNWRELLTEIGVVVIGVCIALGGEQTVEWLHWRSEVAEARDIVAAEMANNVRVAIMRMRSAQCVERRLDELSAILDGGAKNGVLPPVGNIGMPYLGYWSSGAWDSVVASQTAMHFPPQQLATLNQAYRLIVDLADYQAQEITDWNSLYAMVGPGRGLDAASEAKLRDALGHARATDRVIVLNGYFVLGRAKRSGLPFSAADLKQMSDGETTPLVDAKPSLTDLGRTDLQSVGSTCAPLGAVPPAYGQAMWSVFPSLLDETEKTRPHFQTGK